MPIYEYEMRDEPLKLEDLNTLAASGWEVVSPALFYWKGRSRIVTHPVQHQLKQYVLLRRERD